VTGLFKEGAASTESIHMRPRFGFLTEMLSVVFVIAGVGAAQAGFHSGDQGSDKLILWLLAIGFLLVGVGLWMEYLWAWWVGLVTTLFTVVTDLLLDLPDGGWVLWSGFLIAFVITGAQGWTGSRSHTEPHRFDNSGSEPFSFGPPIPGHSDDSGVGSS
jgi:hypothetical protein